MQEFTLNCDQNRIRDLGAIELLKPLTHLTNLTTLKMDLNRNYIKVEGAKELLKPLSGLTGLSNFSLLLEGNLMGASGN